MPKCELRPWKLGEEQVVWINKEGQIRITVVIDHFSPIVKLQYITNRGKWINAPCVNEGWALAILDLLGIPETIEEAKNENV